MEKTEAAAVEIVPAKFPTCPGWMGKKRAAPPDGNPGDVSPSGGWMPPPEKTGKRPARKKKSWFRAWKTPGAALFPLDGRTPPGRWEPRKGRTPGPSAGRAR
jgi:hypothetical protein